MRVQKWIGMNEPVTSKATAEKFLQKSLFRDGEYQFPDANRSDHYYSFCYRSDGSLEIGHGRYGTFEPHVVQSYTEQQAAGEIYKIRKSVNRYFYYN